MEDNKMNNEAIKRINELLKEFNNTFELKARVIEEDEDESAVELTISGLKNNGANFIKIIYDIFNDIIKASSDEHELMYIEGKGLSIAKKVIKKVEKVEYLVEDFE